MKNKEQELIDIIGYLKGFDSQIVRGDLVGCLGKLQKAALIIREQQEEIERLQKEVEEGDFNEAIEENPELLEEEFVALQYFEE